MGSCGQKVKDMRTFVVFIALSKQGLILNPRTSRGGKSDGYSIGFADLKLEALNQLK